MTMSAPLPGEPAVEVVAEVATDVDLGPHPHVEDRRSLRRLWLLTIVVLVLSLGATVTVLAWQWLGPASGTVAH
jgi:hypothetical protein